MPKKLDGNIITGEIIHSWTVKEYEQHERGRLWYVLMSLLGLAFIGYGIGSGDFLFSLIIILGGIIIYLQSHQSPNQVDFQIAELGVLLGSRFYPYKELRDFYIIYNPPEVKTLFLQHSSIFRPLLRISLADENPVEIRQTLRKFLTEDLEKEQEPTSDTFARRWKIH